MATHGTRADRLCHMNAVIQRPRGLVAWLVPGLAAWAQRANPWHQVPQRYGPTGTGTASAAPAIAGTRWLRLAAAPASQAPTALSSPPSANKGSVFLFYFMDVIVLAFVHKSSVIPSPPPSPSPGNHTRANKRTMNCLAFLDPLADVAFNCPRCHLCASAVFSPSSLPTSRELVCRCLPYVWILARTQKQTSYLHPSIEEE